MVAIASMWFAFGLQQLDVQPFPGEVGQPVRVAASRLAPGEPDGRRPLAGLPIEVELPDGSRRQLAATGSDGTLHFVPEAPGTFVYRAAIDGVALVAPHRVVAPRRRWLAALACTPLGLLLLWRYLRPARPR